MEIRGSRVEELVGGSDLDFEDILDKNKEVINLWDGGSKIYQYHQFNIITCNTLDGNSDIIIGDTEMQIDNYCK